MHNLLFFCFNGYSILTPSSLQRCTERFLDTSVFIVNRFEKTISAAAKN